MRWEKPTTGLRILEHEQWMGTAVRWVYDGSPTVELNAPPSVQLEVRRQENKLLVHLVNHTGDTQRPYSFLVPATDMSIVVNGP